MGGGQSSGESGTNIRWEGDYIWWEGDTHPVGGEQTYKDSNQYFFFLNNRRRLVRVLKLCRGFILTKKGGITPKKNRFSVFLCFSKVVAVFRYLDLSS